MSKCKFCEALEESKRIAERQARNDPDPEYEFEERYSAAIVQRTFLKGDDYCRGTITDHGYRHYSDGYPLNFCPECGRELAKNSAIDSPSEKP